MLQRHGGEPKSSAAHCLGEPGQKQATLRGRPLLSAFSGPPGVVHKLAGPEGRGLRAAWSRWEGLIQVGGVRESHPVVGRRGAQKKRELSRVSQTESDCVTHVH